MTMEEAIQQEKHREIYNHEKKSISFKNVRPSQIKNNPRVKLSKPRHHKEESEIATRDTMLLKEMRNYVSKNREEPKVLTASEARGVNKLQKRIAAGTIMMCETDKSSGFAILERSLWESLGEDHVSGDRIIDWEEIRKDQRVIRGHLRCLNHVFRPGANSGCEERVWEAIELASTTIPLLSLLKKIKNQ